MGNQTNSVKTDTKSTRIYVSPNLDPLRESYARNNPRTNLDNTFTMKKEPRSADSVDAKSTNATNAKSVASSKTKFSPSLLLSDGVPFRWNNDVSPNVSLINFNLKGHE